MEPHVAESSKWVLRTSAGASGLDFVEGPSSFSLGPKDVLVRIHAASLNPRDLAIMKGVGKHMQSVPVKESLIPGSDGAGIVVRVGSETADFSVGDRVVMHMAGHISDGEFATTDDMVQGLFAAAAGATVVATTSSEEKAARLKALGASHVINYRSNGNWGEAARALAPNGRGMDHVIDIGGYPTLKQSILATRPDGVVSVIGASGGFDGERSDILEVLFRGISIRGIIVGNRHMFQEMVRFIEDRDIRPAVDDVKFSLKDVKLAIERLQKMEHFSKVIIEV
ncbi:zinc-type alcohol dehydrogenase-like protein [Colletotrichum limetticola]|uniref:Zinc-type alcohol dehydrogenase-like protein n=1 Tax=Colletotrichum limetticola TaxID=1209924 RepID=A0ABQ9PH47_9PEZI|nr:zinc-type alcohol dehydrogenase-like protein [Colletotrichum limetticola]